MTLAFNEQNILADGIHDASLAEVRSLLGRFQRSDRRLKLCAKLEQYVAALQQAEISGFLILDGSFVMGCVDEPEDIDIVLVLRANWDFTADLPPHQYNLVASKPIKRNYPFDVYVVKSGSVAEANWIEFFSRVNVKWYLRYGFPIGATKGLVRIAL